MTTEFRASNGWYIDKNGLMREPGGYVVISPYGADNLREFFQELRDHELGRWRDPELTQAVCYPSEHGVSVLVFHERYGESRVFYRDDDFGETADAQVAKRFFAAHPQHKPWRDAKPGEAWVLDFKDRLPARVFLATDYGTFEGHGNSFTLNDPQIVDARCIWPEGGDGE